MSLARTNCCGLLLWFLALWPRGVVLAHFCTLPVTSTPARCSLLELPAEGEARSIDVTFPNDVGLTMVSTGKAFPLSVATNADVASWFGGWKNRAGEGSVPSFTCLDPNIDDRLGTDVARLLVDSVTKAGDLTLRFAFKITGTDPFNPNYCPVVVFSLNNFLPEIANPIVQLATNPGAYDFALVEPISFKIGTDSDNHCGQWIRSPTCPRPVLTTVPDPATTAIATVSEQQTIIVDQETVTPKQVSVNIRFRSSGILTKDLTNMEASYNDEVYSLSSSIMLDVCKLDTMVQGSTAVTEEQHHCMYYPVKETILKDSGEVFQTVSLEEVLHMHESGAYRFLPCQVDQDVPPANTTVMEYMEMCHDQTGYMVQTSNKTNRYIWDHVRQDWVVYAIHACDKSTEHAKYLSPRYMELRMFGMSTDRTHPYCARQFLVPDDVGVDARLTVRLTNTANGGFEDHYVSSGGTLSTMNTCMARVSTSGIATQADMTAFLKPWATKAVLYAENNTEATVLVVDPALLSTGCGKIDLQYTDLLGDSCDVAMGHCYGNTIDALALKTEAQVPLGDTRLAGAIVSKGNVRRRMRMVDNAVMVMELAETHTWDLSLILDFGCFVLDEPLLATAQESPWATVVAPVPGDINTAHLTVSVKNFGKVKGLFYVQVDCGSAVLLAAPMVQSTVLGGQVHDFVLGLSSLLPHVPGNGEVTCFIAASIKQQSLWSTERKHNQGNITIPTYGGYFDDPCKDTDYTTELVVYSKHLRKPGSEQGYGWMYVANPGKDKSIRLQLECSDGYVGKFQYKDTTTFLCGASANFSFTIDVLPGVTDYVKSCDVTLWVSMGLCFEAKVYTEKWDLRDAAENTQGSLLAAVRAAAEGSGKDYPVMIAYAVFVALLGTIWLGLAASTWVYTKMLQRTISGYRAVKKRFVASWRWTKRTWAAQKARSNSNPAGHRSASHHASAPPPPEADMTAGAYGDESNEYYRDGCPEAEKFTLVGDQGPYRAMTAFRAANSAGPCLIKVEESPVILGMLSKEGQSLPFAIEGIAAAFYDALHDEVWIQTNTCMYRLLEPAGDYEDMYDELKDILRTQLANAAM